MGLRPVAREACGVRLATQVQARTQHHAAANGSVD
jgi:hypothetical protein